MSKSSGAQYPPKRVLDHEKYVRRTDLYLRMAELSGWSLMILATALPLLMLYKGVKAVSGRETVVDFTFGLAATFSVGGAAVTAFIAWLKNASQRRELKRLRERVSVLEKQCGLRLGDK